MKNKYLLSLVTLFVIPLMGCDKTKVVDLRPKVIKDYLSLSKESDICEYLSFNSTGNANKQNYIINLIDEINYFDGPFMTYFSTDKDFENDVQSYKSNAALFEGECALTPGKTYYCKMENAAGEIVYQDYFKTKDTPGAPIYAGQGVSNVRDMGGWKTKSGKKVKYGMVYRGGKINIVNNGKEASEETKQILTNHLHIKTEIDLRWETDTGGQEGCAWEGGNYVKSSLYQYTFFIPNNQLIGQRVREYYPQSKKTLKQTFEVLSDESNYPIYVHCNAGADRTGTFAYLLNGLLGVSYKDLTKDFELTSFSTSGRRWKSDIEFDYDGSYTYRYTKNGIMQNNNDNYVAWDLMHQYMQTCYGNGSNNEQKAIERFLTTEVGIAKEQIEQIKSLLLY